VIDSWKRFGDVERALAAFIDPTVHDAMVAWKGSDSCGRLAAFDGAGKQFKGLRRNGEEPFIKLFAVFFGEVHENAIGSRFSMMNVRE
jgi:hypothetical protein